MELLLEHGADINAVGGEYTTALIAACRWRREMAVKLLLEKGADVNALGDGSRGSALYVASENGYENIVKMLVAKGAVIVMPKRGDSENESSEKGSSEKESSEKESSAVEQEGDTPTQQVAEIDAPASPEGRTS